MKKGILFALLPVIIFIGCESTDEKEELEMALIRMIESDEAISLDGIEDYTVSGELLGDEQEDDLLGRDLTNIWEFPIRWGRRDISISGTVTIEEYETDADTIYATVQRDIEGTLIILNGDTTTIGGELQFTPTDTVTKPFTMQATRRVLFERIDTTNRPDRDWQISGITPVLCINGESTVDVSGIFVERLQGALEDDAWEAVFMLDADEDLMSMFMQREDWPLLTRGEIIRTRVQILNMNPDSGDYPDSGEGVFMHYKRRPMYKGRRALFDDGSTLSWNGHTSHDAVQNDDEFTRLWRIHGLHPEGQDHPCRVFFEVIDYETLLNPDGGYSACMIGFPYFVQVEE